MNLNLAYNIDPFLNGYRGKTVHHKSTGAPTSLAERNLDRLVSRDLGLSPRETTDDEGRPLPVPVIGEGDFISFWGNTKKRYSYTKSDRPLALDIGPHYKAICFQDQSIILAERLKSGWAILPVALFLNQGAHSSSSILLEADFDVYMRAMRDLAPAITNPRYDPLSRIRSDEVIPHWMAFRNFGDLAPRTKNAFNKLSRYFALRANAILPGCNVHFSLHGRPILRDGSTGPACVKSILPSVYKPSGFEDIDREFSDLINHDAYAEERSALAVNIISLETFEIESQICATGIDLGLSEPPTAHDIIEYAQKYQPLLNPA
jgi:hypothetical protein